MKTAWSVAAGIALVGAGAVAILAPFLGALFALWLFGWICVAVGVLELGYGLSAREEPGAIWRFLISTLYLGIGAFLLFRPVDSLAPIALSLGALLVSRCAFLVLLALDMRPQPIWGWFVFDAATSGALGVLVLSGWPHDSARLLGLYVGAAMIANGVNRLVVAGMLSPRLKALQLRRQHSTSGA